MNVKNIDIDNIILMRKSGKTMKAICKELGISPRRIHAAAERSGVSLKQRRGVPESEHRVICERYASGESENQIAKHFGVSRRAIRAILERGNVPVRGQSEAEALKWSQMTNAQRAKQVSKAHEAIRNAPREFFKQPSIAQAITKQRTLSKIGALEWDFIDALESRGVRCVPQKAFGPYNIDIAADDFAAIEIHACDSNPHVHRYFRKRVVNLLEGGWQVIYVKVRKDASVEVAADKLCAMLDLIRSHEPIASQYGMIRGTGELVTSGCLDSNDLACVPASDGFFKTLA